MATTNPFDLLGDDDTEDPILFIAAQQQKIAAKKTQAPSPPAAATKSAKLPTKPLPPTQAVRESRNETGRGGGGRGGRGYGRGRGSGGVNRDVGFNEGAFATDIGNKMGYKEDREKPFEQRGEFGAPRGGFRGGRRGGFSNGEATEGERPRRAYERRSGTGWGNDTNRDGAGRENWGTPDDEPVHQIEDPASEKEAKTAVERQVGEETVDAEKENVLNESEDKEPEEKQMTLEEYEKVLEEKRKALSSLKGEERKVDVDKEFESMQLVTKKNIDDEVFVKLGSDKEKKKDAVEKEDRAKKSVSINTFLKPAEGEGYYRSGGRGRGRGGRGNRGGGYSGGYAMNNAPAPSIEDASQFPSLGGK